MTKYTVKDFLGLNENAWSGLYNEVIPKLSAALERKYGSDIEAEDLAGEVWGELWAKAHAQQLTIHGLDFYAYFRQAVKNKVCEWFRTKKYERCAIAALGTAMEYKFGGKTSTDDAELINAAVWAVVKPEEQPLWRYWVVGVLKLEEAVTLKSLADEIGCNEDTASLKVKGMLRRLRTFIKNQTR